MVGRGSYTEVRGRNAVCLMHYGATVLPMEIPVKFLRHKGIGPGVDFLWDTPEDGRCRVRDFSIAPPIGGLSPEEEAELDRLFEERQNEGDLVL